MKFKGLLNIGVLIIVALTAVFGAACFNVQFDSDFERFFPIDSDDADFYYAYRQKFGSDNEFLMVGIFDSAGVYSSSILEKVDSLSQRIEKLDHVKRVLSITNAELPVIGSFGAASLPVLRYTNDTLIRLDTELMNQHRMFEGSLVDKQGKALCIFIQHKEQLPREKADSLLGAIETLTAQMHFNDCRISGKIKSEQSYLYKTRHELLIFMSISAVLVMIFLWLTFRNAWGVLLPITVVLLSIVWTIGIMTLTGKAIDIMVILMPCILFVVGMSDVIHIASQFYEKIEEGFPRDEAIRLALKEVGFATFLTCISTMVAFLTLNTTSIQPIRDFGTYTAIGVAIAYLLSVTLLPWMLMRVKDPNRFKIHTVNVRWDKFLRRLLLWVFRNPLKIGISTIILLSIAVWGVLQIEVNNSVLDDLSKDDPIKQDFGFFDTHFGGVRGFELAVSSEKGNLLDYESIQFIDKLDTYLVDSMHLSALVSPARIVRLLNMARHDGDATFYKLPASRSEHEALMESVSAYLKDRRIREILSKNFTQGRIAGRIVDKGSLAVSKKNKLLINWLQRNGGSEYLNFRITGSSDLIDKSNQYLTQNMLEGLSLDVLVLMLIIGWMFRSLRMMLISILPNLIPLLISAGIMGIAGIEMKVTISIIFSIAFGIAIDDTLHLLSRFKLELDKGRSLPFAMRTTFLSTGKAMILTAMVIASGFATLMLSDFKSTFYVGLLISLTLVIALLAELVLMPVLLVFLYRKKQKR
jgi:predicted RND superfamily exporter protein